MSAMCAFFELFNGKVTGRNFPPKRNPVERGLHRSYKEGKRRRAPPKAACWGSKQNNSRRGPWFLTQIIDGNSISTFFGERMAGSGRQVGLVNVCCAIRPDRRAVYRGCLHNLSTNEPRWFCCLCQKRLVAAVLEAVFGYYFA